MASDKPVVSGSDTEGREYNDINDMWKKELGQDTNALGTRETWYSKANEYWESVDATIDGVLGGFPELDVVDTTASTVFLRKLFMGKEKTGQTVALDVGAGIGRVSKHLLVPHFDRVDLLEQCTKFVEEAKNFIGSDKMEHYFNLGMQDFTPEDGRYDVIWIQWVIGHLTDEDLVTFMQRCAKGLKPGGYIIVKDNNAAEGFVVDKEDSSVTRSNELLKELYAKSGLELKVEELQKGMPADLFKVRMHALQPKQ